GVAYESLLGQGMGEKLVFGPHEEVYFNGGATAAEARAVGRVLQEQHFFDGQGSKTVLVSRSGDGYSVSFVVRQGAWDRPEVVRSFQDLGRRLSADAFDGKRVEIRLCDE